MVSGRRVARIAGWTLVVLLVATSCTGSSHKASLVPASTVGQTSTTSPASLPGSTLTTAPPTTPSVGGPSCRASQLTISEAPGGAGGGHIAVIVLFKNTSAETCLLGGYPGVAAWTPPAIKSHKQ